MNFFLSFTRLVGILISVFSVRQFEQCRIECKIKPFEVVESIKIGWYEQIHRQTTTASRKLAIHFYWNSIVCCVFDVLATIHHSWHFSFSSFQYVYLVSCVLFPFIVSIHTHKYVLTHTTPPKYHHQNIHNEKGAIRFIITRSSVAYSAWKARESAKKNADRKYKVQRIFTATASLRW